jgi:thimet oligopeptidase
LWSEVFSADMFSRFKNEGVLSSVVGEAYRKCILEPGASEDGIQLIRNYLGRDPTEEAFLCNIGVDK